MRIRTRYWGLGGVLALAATLVLLVALPSSASDRAQHVRWDIISTTGVPPGPLNPGGHASATAANGGGTITLTGSGTFVAPASGRVERRDRGRHVGHLKRRKRHLHGHGAGQLGQRGPTGPDDATVHRQYRSRDEGQWHRRPHDRVLRRQRGRLDDRLPRTRRAARNLRGHRDHQGFHDLLRRSGSCPRSQRRPHELPRSLARERTAGREASTASLPARQMANKRNGVLDDAPT